MKIWVDDVRPAPKGYIWLKNTSETMLYFRNYWDEITEIHLDHDAGKFARFGGDYIEILNSIEEMEFTSGMRVAENCTFKFHSANPVGVANMKRICEKNHWKIG